MAEYTPMMKQYFSVKEQYPDCILMYRLGDFYEMFFDDAKTASKVLEIALTGRDCGQEERAPMCGVPFHAADNYIAKLVENGYSVAICEQMENPAETKGIVKRDVIRVITPGTIMDSAALDDRINNYICALYKKGENAGICFSDITTGEIAINQVSDKNVKSFILNNMSKYSPKEIIVNDEIYKDEKFYNIIKNRFDAVIHIMYEESFDFERNKERVLSQFGNELTSEQADEKRYAIMCLGALLGYLKNTQKTNLDNLIELEIKDDEKYLEIDRYSIRNLELLETLRDKKTKGSLLSVLDATKTSMGGRALRKWIVNPLVNCAKIQNRHRAVDELLKNPIVREEIREALKFVQDIERIISRVIYKTANCKDLLAIASSLTTLPDIKKLLHSCSSGILSSIAESFDTLSDVRSLIDSSIDPKASITLREGNIILDGYNEEVDKYRKVMKSGKEWITEIGEKEKEKTGIKNIKVGFNRVFGYYLEVTKQYMDTVPDYFIRKQTLANAERYITEEIKEIEKSVVEAESSIVSLEYDLFCEIRDKVSAQYERIQKTASAIAVIDVLCSFATVAEKYGYTMPDINMGNELIIKNGRHPVVESIEKNGMFIPNDAKLDSGDNRVAIITGPNMAGKSTYMRQVALIVLMAQIGSFVPAESAKIGIVDSIFTRVGASDDLSTGQSTFMVEMNEVSYILDNATSKSLIILDEIGRGTSTYDGLSIAWSVVEYIANPKKCGAKTLFATHYHELTELEEKLDGVKNYCIAVKKNGDDITFLRKIIRGGADGSYGIEVAALAGVKKEVTSRAKEILRALELRDGNKTGEITRLPKAEKRKEEQIQMSFLTSEDNEVLAEIKKLNLDTMTPVEALTKLYDLKAKALND